MGITEMIFFFHLQCCNKNKDELDDLLQYLNSFHPNLKFTNEESKISVDFLHVTASINEGELESDFNC